MVNRDDFPADDVLLADIRRRLAHATESDPLSGTVELGVYELARILELYDMQDASLLAGEFAKGCMTSVIRKRNATLEAIHFALLVGEPGPLADTISDILRDGRWPRGR